jgi:hypothetical protein
MAKKMWIGLAGAMQRPGVTILGDCDGGYAKVVAPAASRDSFERKVRRALDVWGLELFDLEDVAALPIHILRTEQGDLVFELAEVARDSDAVAFATFHCFDDGEDEDETEPAGQPSPRGN